VWENNFIENLEQVSVQGRGALKGNTFEKADRGNYWSDYVGYDRDGDAIGDQPYESRKLFESLTSREPKLRLMIYSPAHDAIEFIGRAMPAVAPETRFTDASPLIRAATLDLPSSGVRPTANIGWAGVSLLGTATVLAFFAFAPRRLSGGWR